MNNLNPIFNFPLLLEAAFNARKLFRPVRVAMNNAKMSGKTGKDAFNAIDKARNKYLAAATAKGKRAEAEAYLARRMATTDVQRLKDLNLQNAKWTSPTPAATAPRPTPKPAPAAPKPAPATSTPTPSPSPAAPATAPATPTPTPTPSHAPAATPTPAAPAPTPEQIAAQQAAALNASRSRARHYAFGQLTRTTGDVINGTVSAAANTLKHLGYATAGTVGAAGLGTGYLAYNALQN